MQAVRAAAAGGWWQQWENVTAPAAGCRVPTGGPTARPPPRAQPYPPNGPVGKYQFVPGQSSALYPELATTGTILLPANLSVGAAWGLAPHAIPSDAYRADLEEVFAYGRANSTARSREMTQTVYFWADLNRERFGVNVFSSFKNKAGVGRQRLAQPTSIPGSLGATRPDPHPCPHPTLSRPQRRRRSAGTGTPSRGRCCPPTPAWWRRRACLPP